MLLNLDPVDYLVVGAGAASLSFCDTILSELPDTTIAIVDKHIAPGGHWNDAYGYVHLHQPSLLYGVASKQLEGNWGKLLLTGTLPWMHRASKDEILSHFDKLIKEWEETGRVRYFPNCCYDFDKSSDDQHFFSTFDTSSAEPKQYQISVRRKLIDATAGECRVPSQCPPEFPVDEGVLLVPPNAIKDHLPAPRGWVGSSKETRHYVVLGNGKTAMDTVVYLQRTLLIPPSNIHWVISRDVWMLKRNGNGNPWSFPHALLENRGDIDKACFSLEDGNVLTRLEMDIVPTRFPFPVIGADELVYLRKVEDKVRRGRVKALRMTDSGNVSVEFGDGGDPIELPSSYIFVHCTSPGPFNGRTVSSIFEDSHRMTLNALFAPPIPISFSVLAALESSLRKGTLDLAFARKLIKESYGEDADSLDENEVISRLVGGGYQLGGGGMKNLAEQLQPMKLLALFFCLYDKDPMIAYKWIKGNRLSFFSIPGFKGHLYENITMITSEGHDLGFSDEDVKLHQLLSTKLEPLKGK